LSKTDQFLAIFEKNRPLFAKKLPKIFKKWFKNAPFWRTFAFAPSFLAQK